MLFPRTDVRPTAWDYAHAEARFEAEAARERAVFMWRVAVAPIRGFAHVLLWATRSPAHAGITLAGALFLLFLLKGV